MNSGLAGNREIATGGFGNITTVKFREQLRLPDALPRFGSARRWVGVALMLLGLFVIGALLGLDTGIFAQTASFLRGAVGAGAWLVPIALLGFGAAVAANGDYAQRSVFWLHVLLAEAAILFLSLLLRGISLWSNPRAAIPAGAGGGDTGFVFSQLLQNALGVTGGWLPLLLGLIGLCIVIAIIVTPFIRTILARLALRNPDLSADKWEQPSTSGTARAAESYKTNKPTKPTRPMREADAIAPIVKTITGKGKAENPTTDSTGFKPLVVNNARRKREKIELHREPTLPPMSLLKYAKNVGNSGTDPNVVARRIEETLQHFGLVGYVKEIKQGPAVTQFGVEPGYVERAGGNGERRQQKIRVGQIAALQNDLALALSAASLRIEAPIPGKQLVGIEVPNSQVGAVDMRSIIESEQFQKLKAPLAIALGKDVSGTEYAADLGRMPHLLIAGTTGSGKSVCVSAICACLAINNHYDDLKLVMIDPKRVELSRFVGLPHIIGKPEADIERIPAVLRWVVHEMEARYTKFATIGARNIKDFNEHVEREWKRIAEQATAGEGLTESSEDEIAKMPRIVVLIDELADLMMQNPVETEKQLCRLAQMARATGIHLVVATQRPSVDVVTGLIKANFPARISFAVASAMDSRVILDQTGAEQLLGKGDMLFLNPEAGSPVRLQGCYLADKEIDAVIDWWKSNVAQEQAEDERGASAAADAAGEAYVAMRKPKLETPWDLLVGQIASEKALAGGSSRGSAGGSGDDLVEKAMELVRAGGGSVSTSFLQRKLKLGYPRAKALMEELEEMGYVGGASKQAGKGREVVDGEINVE